MYGDHASNDVFPSPVAIKHSQKSFFTPAHLTNSLPAEHVFRVSWLPLPHSKNLGTALYLQFSLYAEGAKMAHLLV